ncbi:DUF3344 domain-containing protein [Methanolobus vulcani]|uniref:DUF3344 domain-containing protein n=1 Tax=Methanolobus vulcani TaxID=38026 RepID=A0A7Z8KM25_9EURY|nr:DUF3344 domain-containing protein [Methanolobus vulcani]TQD23462.1 DUF3344 domain-containing protein [Methanolobus vulcani]
MYRNFAYNATGSVIESGTYLTTVLNNNTDDKTVGIYGVSLLVIYEEPDGQEIEYWINEGAIDSSDIENAKLMNIVPSRNKAGNTLQLQ